MFCCSSIRKEVALNWLIEAALDIPCWIGWLDSGALRLLTDIALKAMVWSGVEQEGKRGHFLCSHRNCMFCALWYCFDRWKIKTEALRYWASKQLPLLSGNQWMPTLMEVLVFFLVLITNKSRIRKITLQGIIGDSDHSNLGTCCCKHFNSVCAPGSAEALPQAPLGSR